MSRLKISGGECPAQAVAGEHFIHPSEAFEMVPVEFARLGHAQSGQNAFRIPAEDRTVRHIGQACHSKRPCPHRVCEIVVRRSFRGDSGLAAMGMDIDRDGFAQHVESGRGGLGGPGGGRRTARAHAAAEHHANRG